jgi:type IV secretory pathway TrbD component
MLGSVEEDPPGYIVPSTPSLSAPLLLGGVPRHIGIVLATASFALGLYITPWVLPIFGGLWLVLAAWTKHDPDGIPIAKRFYHQKPHYYSS